ncbi:uncharacterized protein B0H18DRAFT_1121691 [Fomitopsis serialis]|uniref:uncharacterized protein n=1 Tax=Fomitopsis serialis TaxID=139415 RepID=UPI0020088D1A|nr:uncharacterized protein B0H18DRAFT_1121691 [Neoantrodia serialis]KAH9920966.1 hypothetical protein B0H18DRAFT_1121691 [Neoantrodia serialis]
MPRQHLSPTFVPRSPYSPPLKIWSSPGWERGFALLRHPARASPASTRTTDYPTSESTLCASQRQLSEILELEASLKTVSPPKIPALASPIELKAGARSSCAHVFDYSPLLHTYFASHSPLSATMLTSRSASLHLSDVPDMAPTESLNSIRRLSQSRTSRDHEAAKCNVHIDASTVDRDTGRGHGGRRGSANELIFPPSQYSARLRKLAPPPLQLSPVQHPVIQRRRSFVRDNELLSAPLVDIPLVSAVRPTPLRAPSGALRSAVTAIDIPEDLSTSFSSFEILQWRRRVSRVFDSPMALFTPEPRSDSPAVGTIDTPPAALVFPASVALAESSPHTSSSVESHYTRFDEPPVDPMSTATSVAHTPPPPGRTRLISLPPIPYACSSGEGEAVLSPLIPDLRTALSVPGLIMRAERCAEAVGDAAMLFSVLCSCSLLKEPETIFDLCKSLQQTFHAVQQELDDTPDVKSTEETTEMQAWFQKHWQHISSLERNLNIFYLFADELRARPPRIHRLAGHIDKLHAFRAKFADVARRLAVSHQKLHLVGLRTQFLKEHRAARVQAESERRRRGDFRAMWTEGRARRETLKDEIRHSRARTQHVRHAWMADHGL